MDQGVPERIDVLRGGAAIEGHSSLVLEYKAALAKNFPGENPDYVSLEGYVAGGLLAEGVKRAGSAG